MTEANNKGWEPGGLMPKKNPALRVEKTTMVAQAILVPRK